MRSLCFSAKTRERATRTTRRMSAAYIVVVLVALSILAVAIPTPGPTNDDDGGDSQCNTGSQQCCNTVHAAGSPLLARYDEHAGLSLRALNVPIGVDCSPISVGGIGSGGNCNQQPVCCNGDNYNNGVVVVNCSPINVNL